MKLPFTSEERAFVTYFMVSRPDLVRKGKDPFSGIPKDSVAVARTVPKSIFFTSFIQIVEKKNRG